MNLSSNVRITKVGDYTAAGTSAVNSTAVDMLGYDGVVFVTTLAVAHSGNYVNAAQGDAANGSDAADLAGTKVVATGSNEALWLDIYKPTKRYVRLEAVRTSSSAMGEIYAIRYGGRILPENNAVADALAVELHVSPAEGAI